MDKDLVRECMDALAARLLQEHPEIEQIVVFGSFATGTYVPGSDLDLFVLLSDSDLPIRERVPLYMPDRFPVPLDVFPFTRREVEERRSSPLLRAVEKSSWRYGRVRDS